MDKNEEAVLTETLVKHIDKMQVRVIEEQNKTFEDVQSRLLSLEERGTHPSDQKVQDLEARLAEREEVEKGLIEEVRLLKAIPMREIHGDPAKPNWDGAFIPKALRDDYAVTRTIDTALLASGGKLADDTAEAFIDAVVEQTTTLSRVTQKRMVSNIAHMDELVSTPRSIIAATESTAPAVADSVATDRRTLTAIEIIQAEDISKSFLEENIEREGGEQSVMNVVARQLASDLNDLSINGLDASGDSFLGIVDGFIVKADGDANVTDTDLTGITDPVIALKTVLKAMDSKYRTIPDLAFIANPNHAFEYADDVAARQTAQGDDVLLNGIPNLRYFGFPVISEAFMSDATASILSDRQLIFTPLSNLVFGFQRDVTVDSEWNPRKRVVEYTITVKCDYNHAMGLPYVKGHTMDAALRG